MINLWMLHNYIIMWTLYCILILKWVKLCRPMYNLNTYPLVSTNFKTACVIVVTTLCDITFQVNLNSITWFMFL